MSVYFIRPVGMKGPVKIGCSNHPTSRLRTLFTWSPFPLEIAAETRGDLWTERAFHQKFIQSHERNEWFSWSPELEETIAAIQAGTFDVQSLPKPVGQPCRRYKKPLSDADARVAARIHGEQ